MFIRGVHTRDINRSYPLFAHAVAISKDHYLHIRIAVLGYTNAVDNHIHIPFIYNIFFIFYIICNKFTKRTSFFI
jgi:hypothetical protein